MSVTVSSIIDQSLLEAGDKDGRRITRPIMLGFFNRAQREIATRTNCLETDAYADVIDGEARYAYPEDAKQISMVRFARTSTPTTLGDYRPLDEVFKEQFREQTWAQRPQGYVWGYYARMNWYELLGTPTEAIVDGLLLTYWRVPEKIVAEAAGLVMEVPDFMESNVIEGMKVLSRFIGRERAAAESDWKKWLESVDALRNVMEDRSADRRPAIRGAMQNRPHGGMR